jgi:hypothetical protein
LEEVAVHAGQDVLMEVEYNILLIIGNPHGILDQHLRPQHIDLLYKIIIILAKGNIK